MCFVQSSLVLEQVQVREGGSSSWGRAPLIVALWPELQQGGSSGWLEKLGTCKCPALDRKIAGCDKAPND